MSYNGTVRCSYCHTTGHNRRTCPKLKKQIEENPDGYYARVERSKKAFATKRRCGHCGETGHNIRTCPELAELKQLWKQYVPLMQEYASQVTARLGYGYGHVIQRGNIPSVCVGMTVSPDSALWAIADDNLRNPITAFLDEPKFVYIDPRGVKENGWCPTPRDTQLIKNVSKVVCESEEQKDSVEHHLGYWGYSGSKEKALSFVPFSANQMKTHVKLPSKETKPRHMTIAIDRITKILKQMKDA